MAAPKSLVRGVLRFYKTQAIIFAFLAIIIVGALLLMLPFASRSGEGAGFLTALFTATSATCVTGLVVVDTFNYWTVFGQLVIILLIQVGGLGVMTVATLFWLIAKRSINYNERLFIKESLNIEAAEGIIRLMRHVIIGTFTIEAAGAFLYSFAFVPKFGILGGIYRAVFTAISAFCNAGFDVMGSYGDYSNLVPFGNDVLVNIVTMLLIVIGGIGFVVWEELINLRHRRKLSLHAKIVLIMSASLIVGGTLLFYIFERSNPGTIGGMSLFDKLMHAMFHSVTTRTAGFNTVNLAELTVASKFITIILMFIGGGPGSTAGGVKVTTLFVLLAVLYNLTKNRQEVVAFKRTISPSTVIRAICVVMLGAALVCFGITVLCCNENADFADIVLETVSAFGTVGLSSGITDGLSAASRIMLIFLMFCGRMGMLSAAFTFVKQSQSTGINRIKYPEGKIMVG